MGSLLHGPFANIGLFWDKLRVEGTKWWIVKNRFIIFVFRIGWFWKILTFLDERFLFFIECHISHFLSPLFKKLFPTFFVADFRIWFFKIDLIKKTVGIGCVRWIGVPKYLVVIFTLIKKPWSVLGKLHIL